MTLGKLCKPLFHHWSARDYVRDGLVAMWDGIENAGWGVHDQNATTWVDLIGGNNLPCLAGSVSDSWIRYSSSYQIYIPEPIITGYEFAIQGVYDRSETTGNFCAIGFGYSTARICTGNASSFGCRFSSAWSSLNVSGQKNAITWLRSNADATQIRLFDGETDKGIFQGAQTYSLTESARLCINGENPYGYYRNIFSVANIRIYNRALTADEIARNYAIDKLRFNL